MGREWYWGRRITRGENESPGCMSGMFNLFDLHHYIVFTSSTAAGATAVVAGGQPLAPRSSNLDGSELRKPLNISSDNLGLEAPRNSLELEAATSTSSVREEYFDVPIGVRVASNIVPSKNRPSLWAEEKRILPEESTTPRKPNVVARLMGLELMGPDLSPSPRSPPTPQFDFLNLKSKRHQKQSAPPRRPLQPRDCNIEMAKMEGGSRSLPDTLRPSSVRPSDTGPRLSLQINRDHHVALRSAHEFGYLCEISTTGSATVPSSPYFARSSKKENRRKLQDENQSPRSGHHAREIVKQVKDSISNRRRSEKKKTSNPCYPIPVAETPTCRSPVAGDNNRKTASTPYKNSSYDRYTERIRKKKPSLPTAKEAVIQTQLSRSDVKMKVNPIQSLDSLHPKQSREQLQMSGSKSSVTPLTANRDEDRRPQPLENQDLMFGYVKSVLEHAGVMTAAIDQPFRRYSNSCPIDPIIFHRLELMLELPSTNLAVDGPLRHRWNRKLLFHLVGEILGDLAASDPGRSDGGERLLSRLWSQIRNYPEADCRVAGDIDSLVERDLPAARIRGLLRHASVVEEAEVVASEIERNIFDSVVSEAAASLSLLRDSCRASSEVTGAVIQYVPRERRARK